MADVFSKQKRSEVMATIRSKGNKATEIKLISIFRAHGITGWRRNQKLFGKPDFIFRKERFAVFVDGCFWHGCPKHSRTPRSNVAYWEKKFARNKARDKRVSRELRTHAWRVVRIWEHQLKNEEMIVRRIREFLGDTARAAHGT
jgi:DNA mismatch endonuclease (patch repair protein)